MNTPILQYDFFPHYYTANKDTYETILCECLNKSKKVVSLIGGEVSKITEQENKQPDVVAENSGYEIDFKMMISQTLKEFQSITAPVVQELAPGVRSISMPPQKKQKAVLLWNCCRNMTEERLQDLRSKKDLESKAVVHFFDNVINQNKNILIFAPLFFSTVDRTLSVENQYEMIFKEISSTTSFIHKYRKENNTGIDTFFVYAVNIPELCEFSFIISKFTDNGLEFIDKLSMFSLKSVQTIAIENACYPAKFKITI